MENQDGSRRKWPLFIILAVLLFALFAFQLVFHAVRTSPTIDEGVHILAGYRHLQCGDFGINPEHPPMAKMLAAVPLIFRDLNEPNWDCGSKMTSQPDGFTVGNRFLVENGVDPVVIPTRLAVAVLSLLLAIVVFLTAWEMFGPAEALVALALLAFEPNLIARGSLVMTDMALTVTSLGAVYALYRFSKNPNWVRFLTVGLAVGLMLAAKHSAVFFVPVLFVLLIADTALFRQTGDRVVRQLAQRTGAFAAFFLIGLIVLWTFYGFRYYSIPSATGPVSITDYVRGNDRPELGGSLLAQTTQFIGNTHIFPESYVLGMADVIAGGNRASYLFGRSYPNGKWFYFPISFLVKTSVALLLLLPLGLVFPFFDPEKRREMIFLLFPPVVFFTVAMFSNLNLGIRHVLPIYGFFIVAAAAGAVWLARRYHVFKFVLIAILVFHAVAAVRTTPNYLAFSNDFWGGTDNAYRIFTDGNLENGQSVKLVNEYIARENITDCWFAAWVHPEIISATQPCRVLPSGHRSFIGQTVIEPVPPVIEGTIFVSVSELPPRGGNEYLPITQSEPVAFIGGNTVVYSGRFEVPLASAISRAHRSGQFLRANRMDDAVFEGRTAVELGPEDPRTHLALGLALVRAEQKEEGRRELERVVELAKPDPRFRNQESRAQTQLDRLNRR